MKVSNKILLILLGLIALSIFSILVTLRVLSGLTPGGRTEEIAEGSTEVITKSYDFDDFTGLKISEAFEVVVTQDDEFLIEVTGPEVHVLRTIVRKEGKTLRISMDKPFSLKKSPFMKIKITMPALEKANLEGAVTMTVNNFATESLAVKITGACTFIGHNVEVTDLNLSINGASNAQLGQNNAVKNARISVSGASSGRLHMTGGSLSGSISGASSVIYSGSVSTQQVRTDGVSSLRKD